MTAAARPDSQPAAVVASHAARTTGHANFALSAMYAHRLWINLWMTLGHPAENYSQPGGNKPVTVRDYRGAHSRPERTAPVSHSACARPSRRRPAQTLLIPGIHRPYDDYQFSYVR